MSKRSYEPDPRPEKRIKNKGTMKELHSRVVTCVLCGEMGNLHHVYPRSQGGDDVRPNFVGLCGSGVSGCHGLIEGNDEKKRRELGIYIVRQRPDTVAYLRHKLGEEQGREWLRRRLFTP